MKNNKITRREFIKSVIGGSILIASGSIFSGCNSANDNNSSNEVIKDNKTADLEIDYLRQIVTENPSSSRCIMWQVDDELKNPEVELRLNNSDELKKFIVENSSFTDDGHKNYQYTSKIDGLNLNTDYEYRIVDGEHCTNWNQLKILDDKNFKMLIFPDSQSADYDYWSELAKSAYERNQDAAIFVNVGDIVDNGEDRHQWQAWLNGVDNLLEAMPFIPVMGNHECYNRQWKTRLPEAYLKYFNVPNNGSEKFNCRYYSFDYGDVHFAILDSQWDELDDIDSGAGQNLINEQREWLRRDMSASSKKWKIIFIHKDVLQYRIHGRPERREGFSDIGTEFMPLFDELKIDIVFTAHLHTYRDRGHIYNFEHNPQGPLYILTGVAGDVRYPGLWINHALDEFIAPQPETNNYLTMQVSENQIDVYCFLPDGKEIDHAVVTIKN